MVLSPLKNLFLWLVKMGLPIMTYQEKIKIPIEIYIQPPTQFLRGNYPKLLPEWLLCPRTIIIVLLHSQFALEQVTQQIQDEKTRLKDEFLKLGQKIQAVGRRKKCLVEVINPQDGKPINSASGEITFDIVAVVHELLGLSFSHTKDGCKILRHPFQKTAIYPSLLVANGSHQVMNSIVQEILT